VARQPSHQRLGLRERGVRRFAELVFSNSGCVSVLPLLGCTGPCGYQLLTYPIDQLTLPSHTRRHGRLGPLVSAIDALITRRRTLGLDNVEWEDRCVFSS